MWFVYLTHWLFGWHFVSAPFALVDRIRRVKRMPNGRLYIKLYGDFIYLDDPTKPITPLTWIEDGKVIPLKRVG